MAYKTLVRKHFDDIAHKYDCYKKKNEYYYSQLKKIFKSFIPPNSDVLEIGCGTGEILHVVAPQKGVGVDISLNMINIATSKYKDLIFEISAAEDLKVHGKYEFIIMSDVIDHLDDFWDSVNELKKKSTKETKVIVSSINPLWTIPLEIAEKLKLKTPEGPHNWIPNQILRSIFELNDFEIIHESYQILIPKHIPGVSDFINSRFYKIPVIRNLGLVQVLVAKPKSLEDYKKTKPSCSIIIPCYNEEGNIAECLERIVSLNLDSEIIVVDDGSDDRTSEIANELKEKYRNIKLVSYENNRGKGYAVQKGFEAATKEILIILDADMTVPPEDLPKFMTPLVDKKAQFVNGTRMVYAMEKGAVRYVNLIGNRLFSLIFSWLLGQKVTDTLCGTKALFRTDFKRIKMKADSWPDFDLLFGAAKQELKIVELPVRYRRRLAGESKMKTFKHGWILFKMCFRGFRELKL